METRKPPQEFGRRKPVVARPVRPGPPAKRSGHVALLLMGTFAVGGAGYALMPGDRCERPPNVAQPSLLQSNAECPPRGSSSSGGGHGGSGGSSSRSGFYSGDSSSGHSATGTSSPSSDGVTRGGFGSFAHAFGFSGG